MQYTIESVRRPARSNVTKTFKKMRGMNRWVRLALTVLLISCSNILLLNQRVAIQSGQGQNLLSVRDGALIVFILLSFPSLLKMKGKNWNHPLTVVTIGLVAVSLPLGVVGLLEGNEIRDILTELNCVMGWFAGVCLLAVVDGQEDIAYILNVTSALGAVIAVGVFGEIFLRVPLVTGGTGQASIVEGVSIVRSTPSCWPLLCASTAILTARVTGDQSLTGSKRLILAVVICLEVTACIATLGRTLVVAFVVSSVAIAIGLGRRGVIALVVAAGVIVTAWFGSLAIGERAMGVSFGQVLEQRYSVFNDRDQAERYNNSDLRSSQIRAFVTGAGSWLLVGSGLGTAPWKVNAEFQTTSSGSDVSFVQLGTRYGLWGLLFLLVLAGEATISLARRNHVSGNARWMTVGLSSTLCGLWVAGIFGNMWSLPSMAPVVMLLYFLSLSMRTKCPRNAVRARA